MILSSYLSDSFKGLRELSLSSSGIAFIHLSMINASAKKEERQGDVRSQITSHHGNDDRYRHRYTDTTR